MNILSISLDKKLFLANSMTQRRVLGYRKMFGRYDLIVMAGKGYKNIKFDGLTIHSTNSFNKLFYVFDAYKLGKKIINQYKSNAVSAQDPFETGLVGWLLAKKYKLKLQIQLHGDFFGSKYWRQESFLNNIKYYIGKYIIKQADIIRVVSQRIRNSLIKEGVRDDKIVVMPIHVDTDNADKARLLRRGVYPAKSGAPRNDEFVFLTVGRLVPVKNIGMQIKALSNIIKQYPYVELWIAGEGEEKRNLKFEIGNLGLEDNIKLFGWQDDLGKFYRQADVFLLTSNYEGWGMVIIEAASYGLPIIMTDVGCAGEVIKNGESGIVIPVGDQKKLEQAMRRLVEDRELRKKLGENAKQVIMKLPSKKETLSLYLKSLQKAVS